MDGDRHVETGRIFFGRPDDSVRGRERKSVLSLTVGDKNPPPSLGPRVVILGEVGTRGHLPTST